MMRVVLADDRPRAREAMEALLLTADELDVVGTAGGGREALDLVDAHRPDILLVDVEMPDLDGLAVTRAVKARWPKTRVVVVSMMGSYRGTALEAGADAFVDKAEAATRLLGVLLGAAA
jgi:DNA-binding NarL/FixJ family response regulator